MATERYDVAVLGLGGMGSAAIYHLAKRDVSVCGIERHGVAHDLGSSHGATRLIRKAYFEHPDYIPLLDRAYELWRELGQESGHSIFTECGLLISGPENSPVIDGLGRCYAEHDLPHERITAADAQQRYARFRFPADHVVYVDPIAGYLRVERGVEQHIALAQRAGARVLIHEDALSWRAAGDCVTVKTAHREIEAGTLVICAGPWAQEVLAEIRVPLVVRRKVQAWFKPKAHPELARTIPAFFFHLDSGMFYGTPELDDAGVKIAEHSGGDVVADPDDLQRRVTDADTAPLHRVARELMPDFDLRQTHVSVCMYTMTPDEHFIIDRHPEHANVLIAAGFSGHGYKFATVVGETLAQLALDGATPHPIDFLRLDREALRRNATS